MTCLGAALATLAMELGPWVFCGDDAEKCVAIHPPRSGSADSSSPWARTPSSARGTGAAVMDPARVLQFEFIV